MALRQVRRIAAYGVCRDEVGRVLLVRVPDGRDPNPWNLPGGALRHGEDPVVAVVRRFREESGLAVDVLGVREVSAEVTRFPGHGVVRHQDQVIYDTVLTGSGQLEMQRLRTGAGGSSIVSESRDSEPGAIDYAAGLQTPQRV